MKRPCKIIGHAWDYSWHGKDYTFKICTDCGAHRLAFPESSPHWRKAMSNPWIPIGQAANAALERSLQARRRRFALRIVSAVGFGASVIYLVFFLGVTL